MLVGKWVKKLKGCIDFFKSHFNVLTRKSVKISKGINTPIFEKIISNLLNERKELPNCKHSNVEYSLQRGFILRLQFLENNNGKEISF